MSILNIEDFIINNEFRIVAFEENTKSMQHYIDSFERYFLKFILGEELYYSYLNAPTEDRFNNLINGELPYYDDSNRPFYWVGLKNMLKYFFYSDFVSAQTNRKGSSGTYVQFDQVDNVATMFDVNQMYNNGIDIYKFTRSNFAKYMYDMRSIFPEFRYNNLERRFVYG